MSDMSSSRLGFALAIAAAALALGASTSFAADSASRFDLPAESLDKALRDFAIQMHCQISYEPALVAGLQAPEIRGEYTPSVVLSLLLKGTNLRAVNVTEDMIQVVETLSKTTRDVAPASEGESAYDGNGMRVAYAVEATLTAADVMQEGTTQNSNSTEVPADKKTTAKKQESDSLDEVVVTGTHIRGTAPTGSSLKVYTHEDIEKSGAATVDQFARQMTENFSGADSVSNFNSNAVNGVFSQGANDNQFGGSSFNLHGLGTTSTLTLLNGHRIAPAGANGLLTDISLIPLSAIDHIEVLADGASAIYGADAVAGVVNIVTRKNFNGAETSLRYSGATDGGDGESLGSQLLGTSWSTGNALLNYEYDKQDGLDASQRSYIPDQGGPYSLVPETRRNSVLLTGDQELSPSVTLSGEAIYSERNFQSSETANSTGTQSSGLSVGNARQTGLTLSLETILGADWRGDLTGNYSGVNQIATNGLNYVSDFFSENSTQLLGTKTDLLGIDATADGEIFHLPGGDTKLAIGGNFHTEQFDAVDAATVSGVTTNQGPPRLQRHVESAYGEVLLPIIGTQNSRAFAQRVDLSAAIRYDHYSDFGSATNPKFGLSWEPVRGVGLRTSYGTSFQAPPLGQLGSPIFSSALPLSNPSSKNGETDTLYVDGGNPALSPERSRSFTAGVDLAPQSLRNLTLNLTYFFTSFRDRIATPTASLATVNFHDPSQAPFIIYNPPLALVESYFSSPLFSGNFTGQGPGGIQALYDNQLQNIASTKQVGLDFAARYDLSTAYGQFNWSAGGTRLIRNDFQTVPTAAAFSLLNTFAQPTAWRVRGGMGWTQEHVATTIFVNFVNSYENTPLTPPERIASWVTADWYLSYKTGELATAYLPRNLTVALSIQNLADRRPPFANVQSSLAPGQKALPFDPTNASPVGRLIGLQFRKAWGAK